MRIRLFRPLVPEPAIDEVAEVLRSGWLGPGPKTFEFEHAFAGYVDAPHCVGVSSGTAAVHLALHLLDLPDGAEVITTANTFVSTNHAILYERAKPVFADIEASTGNISATSIAERLTDETRAIVVVHYGGCPCDIDEIYDVARSGALPVVEDCAHATGATYKGRTIGGHGDLHAFSFSPVKNIATPGGGAITVRSPEHDARLRRLRTLGVDQDSFVRNRADSYSWDYDVTEVGFRANMNDVSAVIAHAQLREIEASLARRAEIWARYVERLVRVPGVTLPSIPDDRTLAHYMFWIFVDERDALIKKLWDADIEAGVCYRRNDLYPMFEKHELPQTEWFWRHQVTLPMHTTLTDDEVDTVCDEIESGW